MSIIFGVIIAIIALIFAFQNSILITVSFFAYQFETSLALVILGALLIGLIVGLLAVSPSLFKLNMENRGLAKMNRQMKDKVDSSGIMYETDGLGSESERIPGDISRTD